MTADLDLPLRFSRWFLPLAWLTGMWPSRSFVRVADGGVDVAMGWAFRARFPAAAVVVVRATRGPRWGGVGVHGFGGTWVVNGSLHGVVELHLRNPARARVLGVPVRLRRLFVSVTDPTALVSALTVTPVGKAEGTRSPGTCQGPEP
jgi:hypothetical protein